MAVLLSRDGFWASQDPVSEALPPTELQRISPVRGHFLSGQFHFLRFRLLCSMLSLPTDSQPTRTHAEWQGQWKDTLSWVKAFTVYLLCPRDKKRGLWNVPGAGGRPFVSVLFKPENGENENESIQELWPWSRKKRTPPPSAPLWQMDFSIRCWKQKNKSWPSFLLKTLGEQLITEQLYP